MVSRHWADGVSGSGKFRSGFIWCVGAVVGVVGLSKSIAGETISDGLETSPDLVDYYLQSHQELFVDAEKLAKVYPPELVEVVGQILARVCGKELMADFVSTDQRFIADYLGLLEGVGRARSRSESQSAVGRMEQIEGNGIAFVFSVMALTCDSIDRVIVESEFTQAGGTAALDDEYIDHEGMTIADLKQKYQAEYQQNGYVTLQDDLIRDLPELAQQMADHGVATQMRMLAESLSFTPIDRDFGAMDIVGVGAMGAIGNDGKANGVTSLYKDRLSDLYLMVEQLSTEGENSMVVGAGKPNRTVGNLDVLLYVHKGEATPKVETIAMWHDPETNIEFTVRINRNINEHGENRATELLVLVTSTLSD